MTSAVVDGVERYKAQIRLTRWISIGGALLLAGLGLYYAITAEVGAGWTRASFFVSVFALFISIVLLIGGFWKWSAGAAEVSVDGAGITFKYPSGRIRRVLWSGQGLPLTIQHTEGVDDEISRGRPVQAVSGRLWLQDFLSTEAYREILTMAKNGGLSLTESPGLRPGWTRQTISPPTAGTK